MSVRQPCALNFYKDECSKERIDAFVEGFRVPREPSKIVAGIVPHAGWMFSGATAAKVFKCIKEKSNPSTFVVLGAIHRWGVRTSSVYARGAWMTPFGKVEVDEDTATVLLNSMKTELVEDPGAHSTEHSIEVQVPFIKHFFPEAKIVPIMVIPGAASALIGQKIGEMAFRSGKEVVIVGTTDLTHYGDNYEFAPRGYGPEALEWMKENDSRIIAMALAMRAGDVLQEAHKNHNACGAGAMAATISAAEAMGAKGGILVEYTTSHEVLREKQFTMAVGYAGIVF